MFALLLISHAALYIISSLFFFFFDMNPELIEDNKYFKRIRGYSNNKDFLSKDLFGRMKYYKYDTKLLFNVTKNFVVEMIMFYGILQLRNYYSNINGEVVLFNFAPIDYLAKFIIIVLMTEVLHYYLHRLFHTKQFYRYHKLHHAYTNPIAMSVKYYSTIENVEVTLANIFAPLMFLPKFLVLPAYMIGISASILGHCGYIIPVINSTSNHDIHHEKFFYNYANIFMDDICGTKYVGKKEQID